MRFMIMVKEGETPMNRPPNSEEIAEMGRYNRQLIDAGILLAMEGLLPSKFSSRVKFTNKERRQTIDGPFSETKELIGGFWIIEVPDKQTALDWAHKIPFSDGEEVEIRRVAEPEDFEYNEISAEALDMEKKFHAETRRRLKG
jgi:hypothetical protein